LRLDGCLFGKAIVRVVDPAVDGVVGSGAPEKLAAEDLKHVDVPWCLCPR
jgi:hypothetical protein